MATPNSKRMYGAALIGCGIRRTIGKTTTYRLRRGNGQYGAELHRLYQDKFTRVVPSSINNTSGEPYRAMLRAAVIHWQYALTADEKKEYNRLAGHLQHLSGYNLFIRRAIKGEIKMYVDRGDPDDADFDVNDFTKDGTWRDLDLSSIVPAGAVGIVINVFASANAENKAISFRKNGNTYGWAIGGLITQVANQGRNADLIINCDINRVIEYSIPVATWAYIYMTIKGWWT